MRSRRPDVASTARRARRRGPVENNLRVEKDRWWDEDRRVCHRPGLAERFTTILRAAVSVSQVLEPGGQKEPLKAQAEARDGDIERAITLLTT